MKPKYPVYIISKGRADQCLTANFMLKDKVKFRIVVEPQEKKAYAKHYDEKLLLVTPFKNLGRGSIPVRNFIWDHSSKEGYKRHWCIDDNIRKMRRLYKSKRIGCNANIALAVTEDFVDRYENVAVAGLNYTFFVVAKMKPFILNCRVYSCMLINNSIPQRWRGRYNEDTDLCLQVLAGGYCTILMNAFMIDKMATMLMKGGNTDQLYKADGRLTMARSLERKWPGVVKTKRKFKRPQHQIKNNWACFDNKLIRRTDIDWDEIRKKTYKFNLVQQAPIKSERLRRLIKNG